MSTRLRINKAGRIVIPKPVRGTGPLTQEHGVWVFRTGQPMAASTSDEMRRRVREDRDLANLGVLRRSCSPSCQSGVVPPI